MTDIGKCDGKGCDRKERCWRYLAPADRYQTYMKIPFTERGEKCQYFWEVPDGK